MSLANTVGQALNQAQAALGDLVKTAVLKSFVSKTYTNGQYVKTYNDLNVDVVTDKFSYHEQEMPDYQQTDIKLVVFNPLGNLNLTIQDMMVWGTKELSVISADPVYVGNTIPVWSVVLRQ